MLSSTWMAPPAGTGGTAAHSRPKSVYVRNGLISANTHIPGSSLFLRANPSGNLHSSPHPNGTIYSGRQALDYATWWQ